MPILLTWIAWIVLALAALIALVVLILNAYGSIHVRQLTRPITPEQRRDWRKRIVHTSRMVLVAIGGLVLLLAGVLLLVTPGPGVPLILAGLALLSTEFVWAQVLLRRFRKTAEQVSGRVGFSDQPLAANAGPFRRFMHWLWRQTTALLRWTGLDRLWRNLSGRFSAGK